MNDRVEFLDRIRGALGRSEPLSAPTSEPPSALGADYDLAERVRTVEALSDTNADGLMDALAVSGKASGWNVARVANVEEACAYVLEVARDLEARSAVHSLHRVVREVVRDDLFSAAGIELTPIAIERTGDVSMAEESRSRLRDTMANADVGITGVDYAIAETGTCVIVPTTGASRLVSLLPPVHVALVERGQVVASLDELFTMRRHDFLNGDLGSYMNLITGPSRTADIEYKLVTGVHGPGEVHMVLIG